MTGCSFNYEGRCNHPEHDFSETCPNTEKRTDRHCIASHGVFDVKLLDSIPPLDDHDIQGAWLLPGIRVVNSSAVKARIDSEGRWGFFVGLLAGISISLLVKFFEF